MVGKTAIALPNATSTNLTQLSNVIGFTRFDGVLRAELFQNHIVTIDPIALTLTIEDREFRPDKTAIGVPFVFEKGDPQTEAFGMPIVEGTVNGIRGNFEIDTGDHSTVTLFGPFWRYHQLDRTIGTTLTTMSGYGLGGPIQSIVGRPKQFTLGQMTLPPPVTRLSLQKAGAFTRGDYAGSIGMGMLKRFVISFEYPHHMLWLVKNQRFDAPDRYDRSGLWLGLSGSNDISVIYVAAKSPAAEAGLDAGDKIDEVNGTPANPGTLFRVRKLLSNPALQAVVVRAHRGAKIRKFHLVLRNLIDPTT